MLKDTVGSKGTEGIEEEEEEHNQKKLQAVLFIKNTHSEI